MSSFYDRIAHPVDWRYGSDDMRRILSPSHLVKLYAKIEAVVAETQAEAGLIPKKAAEEIRKVADSINFEEVIEEEKIVKHDIIAVINVLSNRLDEESARYIHYGLTSQDVKDTALALILKDSLKILERKLITLIRILINLADKYQDLPCVGRTHGVHANIYSFGHKFAVFADEFIRHVERLQEGKKRFLVGKLSGAVGIHAITGELGIEIEKKVMEKLGLTPAVFATQIVPRDRYAEFFMDLALISTSLDKIATEIRNLHRTEIGEAMEAFKPKQAGSSAMPHKQNPIDSENVSGLSRIIRGLTVSVLENIVSWHERDLSNSSAERVLLADYLLLVDEQLTRMIRVLGNIRVDEERIRDNIWYTRGLIFSEHVMYLLISKGLRRKDAHLLVKELSVKAFNEKRDFVDVLLNDRRVGSILSKDEILELFKPEKYVKTVSTLLVKLKKRMEKIIDMLDLKTLDNQS